jgi:hypothetical protein
MSTVANTSALNISSARTVKAGPGRLVSLSVVNGGTGGTINDCASTGAVAAGNEFCNIPTTVGVYELDWPCLVGITVVPGASQVVAVSYS